DAFDQCLKKMREIDFIPCLFVSYALSRQQVALLSEQLEAKAVKAGRLSFYDRPPMDSLKRNRLLEAVSQCSCFTELNFYSGSLRDDDIVLLASLFQKHPSICKITMNGFALSRAGVGQLLKLYRDSPSLTSLGMFGCSDHEMKELIEKLQGNSIQ